MKRHNCLSVCLWKPQSSSKSPAASVGTTPPTLTPIEFAVGVRMALAEMKRQRNAVQLTYRKAGKVWLSIQSSAIGGSEKFPRVLAWKGNFRGLKVTAIPFPTLPPSRFPHLPLLRKVQSGKLHLHLLSKSPALCR